MQATTNQTKICASLRKTAAVQAQSTDPRLRLDATMWELFFSLEPNRLIEIREAALRNEDSLAHALAGKEVA